MLDDRAAVPVEPAEEPWPPRGPHGPFQYILWHWRGWLPLGFSFWINLFFLSILLRVVHLLVVPAVATAWSTHIRLVSVLALAFTVASLVVQVWQIVGTWRAAGNHMRHYGKKLWPGVAMAVLVLVALSAAGAIKRDWPALEDSLLLAYGKDQYAKYIVVPPRNNNELKILGTIGLGLTEKVRETLDGDSGIGVIMLESDGGRVGEARALHELIKERGLDTETAIYCISACTVAFIAGNRRVLHTGAALGFHAHGVPGLSGIFFKIDEEIDRQIFKDAGVDEVFAGKVFATPFHDMWFPTEQELVDAGFVTEIVSP